MKKITTLLALIVCASSAFSQTVEKSQSIMIYDIKPTLAPCTYCSERIFVRADNSDYWWDGVSWEPWYSIAGLAGKLDSLSYSPATDTSYTVARQYAGGSVIKTDTIWFPAVSGGGGSGTVQTIVGGVGISVDATDPENPIVTNSNPDQNVTVVGAGVNDVTGAYPNFTVTGTEVDGDIANEGQLGVTEGTPTSSMITTNTTGANPISLQVGSNMTITEVAGTNGGIITLDAVAGLEKGVLDYVLIADADSPYNSRAEFVTNGVDDHVEFEMAADSAIVRGIPLVCSGTFIWGDADSINISGSIDIYGASGNLKLDTIKTPPGWDARIPLIRVKPPSGGKIETLGINNLVINTLGSGNAAQGLRTGVIRMGYDTLQHLAMRNIDVYSTGNFQSSVSFKFEDIDDPGYIGEIAVEESYFYSDVFNTTGQYGFYNSLPCGRFIWDHSDVLMDGDTIGGNTFNALAVYGGGQYASVTNSKIESLDRSHSPLAFSPFKNVVCTGNFVIGGENENFEFCIEFEEKGDRHRADPLARAPVGNFIISNNVVGWLNQGPTATNYGIGTTDRDVGVDTIRPYAGVISNNSITGAEIGVYIHYGKNVIVSGNVYEDCNEEVSYGRTDLGHTALGSSHYNNIQANGVDDEIGIYDTQSRSFEPFVTQLYSGTDRYTLGQFINIYGDLLRVDFGSSSQSITTRFYSNRFEIINSSLSLYIGEEAGDNATGLFGTFGGYRAGRYNTTTSNTGWGAQIMSTSSFAGVANVAIGTDVLQRATTANGNTGGGYRNMQELTTGDNMSSWGREGFQFATTATGGSGIGFKHGLYENCTDCLVLGRQAGKQTSPAQNLTGHVLIGPYVGQNNTQSNRYMVDNTNTETPLLDGRFDLDSLAVHGDLDVIGNLYENGHRVFNTANINELRDSIPGDGNGLGDGSVVIPDGIVTAINSDGAGITWNADNLDISAISLTFNGKLYRPRDTINILLPAHPFGEALATGTTYRSWRTPSDLNGARIIGINYTLETAGSGDVIVQITDGTINTGAATIPSAAGYVDTSTSISLTTGEKWTPSVFSISGTGHEGLSVQFIIERK